MKDTDPLTATSLDYTPTTPIPTNRRRTTTPPPPSQQQQHHNIQHQHQSSHHHHHHHQQQQHHHPLLFPLISVLCGLLVVTQVASFYFLLSRLEGLKGRLDSTEAMEGRQESMLSRELLWLKSQVKDIKEEWRSRARDGTAEDTCTPLGCKQTQPTTP
ncbi:hypothetical protein Pcinc_009953 [Petrolisthes cinctipes]|uniref:Uncharacterized protein n=1 Tax=Petrolisthes cinctipes TaxID=88211 RepID=A0AAE1FVI0_PETCI|nr:hypothetical protein Pcinc_014231 [Petrolisthes cinctipes]KAK3885865.1 hypothetical protein Pcinc_009953 [Petrolisthes cinctipes]